MGHRENLFLACSTRTGNCSSATGTCAGHKDRFFLPPQDKWGEWACSDDGVTELCSRPVWLIYKYKCSLFTQTCKQQKVNNTAQLGLTNRLLLFRFRTWGVLDISQKLYWQQTQEGYEVTLTLSSLHGNHMDGAATWANSTTEATKQVYAKNPPRACLKVGHGWSWQYLLVSLQLVHDHKSSLYPWQITPSLHAFGQWLSQSSAFTDLVSQPCAWNIAPFFLPRSVLLLDVLGQAFAFQVTLQEGQWTVPVATRSWTLLLKEEPATVWHIAPIPVLFSSLSKTRIKGNISCKSKTIWK